MIGTLQLPINTSEFFKDFLPGFIATVLGIPIALPFALWTNSLIVAQTEKAKQKEEAASLFRSLTAIKEALTFNSLHFGIMLQTFKDNRIPLDDHVDSSTWDAVKADVVQYLDDPSLKRRIAYHFSRMKELHRLQAVYIENTVGTTASLWQEPPLKQGLSEYLPEMIAKLLKEAQLLSEAIDLEQAKILRKYRLPTDPG